MLGLHFTPACILLSVCSLHFTRSLHFTPGPQSAVRSPQSSSYTDRIRYRSELSEKARENAVQGLLENQRLRSLFIVGQTMFSVGESLPVLRQLKENTKHKTFSLPGKIYHPRNSTRRERRSAVLTFCCGFCNKRISSFNHDDDSSRS